MTTQSMKGLKELHAFLAAFPDKVQTGAMRSALRAAAAPITEEAKMRVARKSGKLARAISTGSPRKNQDGSFSVSIRPDPKKPHSFLGYFLEYGVQSHVITVREHRRSRTVWRDGQGRFAKKDVQNKSLVIGQHFVGPSVTHPGFSGTQFKFMRPALDAKWREAAQAFADRLASYLKGKTGFTAPSVQLDEAA